MSKSRIDQVIKNIQENKLDDAFLELNECDQDEQYFKYLGLLFFLKQDYKQAVLAFEKVKNAISNDSNWNEVYQKSTENAFAESEILYPSAYLTDKKELEALFSSEIDINFKVQFSFKKKKNVIQYILDALGNILGHLGSWKVECITYSTGKWIGYKDQVWTNWYNKSTFISILCLAYMRNQLNKFNLYNTYTSSEKNLLNGYLQNPPATIKKYRTLNGTFNNLSNPIEGAAGTRFQRNINNTSCNQITDDNMLTPDPRIISRLLLTRKGEIKKAPFINLLAAAWIQFENHDWISHSGPNNLSFHSIPLQEDDPIRIKYKQSNLFIGKTPQDPYHSNQSQYNKTFINEVTHWWDGSQIYGSSDAVNKTLRSFQYGKLNLSMEGTLPLNNHGLEITGFSRNWWVGLTLFHTLFAKEHNTICDELAKRYPSWDDNNLFHTARLINAALMAKMHTLEWNSAINPHEAIYKGNHSNWYGLLTTLRKKENWKTIEDINISNTELGGVVGNPTKKFGSDYGLTQEFVEAYRIHSMLPEHIQIKDINDKKRITEVPFTMTRQAGSAKLLSQHGFTNMFYSFGIQNPGQVVLQNYPRFLQELSIPGNPIYDMGTVDILRARERQVPRYNEFRRQIGLNPIHKWEDLTSDIEIIHLLKSIYGEGSEGIELLDFMIGTLAEDHRPKGFAFGETMFQLFLLNATRRLQADRFYTEYYKSEYYTEFGLEWIDKYSLKDILLRQYPELKNSGLINISNAFEPWDDQLTDLSRHPLRAFDQSLKKFKNQS